MAAPKTKFALNDENADFLAVTVTSLSIDGTTVEGGVLLGTSEVVDLQGESGALVFDADGDTTMDSATDDQLDIVVAGALDFQITANTLTALSGSVIETDDIAETTSDAGVTVDGALIKDGVIQAGQQDDVVAIVGDGAITVAPSTVFLSKGTPAAITIVAPTTTTHDGYIIRIVDISGQAHVVTSSVEGFNAKGSSGTLTFAGNIGEAVTLMAYQGDWYTITLNGVTPA
jgi:hypothetical protein